MNSFLIVGRIADNELFDFGVDLILLCGIVDVNLLICVERGWFVFLGVFVFLGAFDLFLFLGFVVFSLVVFVLFAC